MDDGTNETTNEVLLENPRGTPPDAPIKWAWTFRL
jgi:hypothetical protein